MDSNSDENGEDANNTEEEEKGGLSSCGYCGKLRNLNVIELMCNQCYAWFHQSCISYQLGKCVPFMLNYTFTCKNCSPTGVESFRKLQAQHRDMCITAIANLQHQSGRDGHPTKKFSFQKDIIPFLEQHWEAITTAPRRTTHTWHGTLQKTLMKEVDTIFTVEENIPGPHNPFFGLITSDLTLIRPSLDYACGKNKGTKRKLLDSTATSKKSRNDMPAPKLHGYPVDHPYNKEGFRYVLAEPDPHAPFRREFDESNDMAGKPIPGWMYRAVIPHTVLLALHDRAPQLKPTDDRLAVIGEKGYCLIRATHGVRSGTWYYECTIRDQPEGSHVRLGWCQQLANLQAPLGYDKFGYSWRSRKGTVFHEAKGKHYAENGFKEGDVLGVLIYLPSSNPVDRLPQTYKDKRLVKFRSHTYYSEQDDVPQALKSLKPLPGSKIVFFKNGVCIGDAFRDVYGGVYYPGVSLYKGITLSVNFGPEFEYPPSEYQFRGIYEKGQESVIEQTLADLIYLVENEGKLRLDIVP